MEALTANLCKSARMLMGWTAQALSDAANVPIDTLRSFESGRTKTMSRENEAAIRSAFESRGIQFLEDGQVAAGPGVALRGNE